MLGDMDWRKKLSAGGGADPDASGRVAQSCPSIRRLTDGSCPSHNEKPQTYRTSLARNPEVQNLMRMSQVFVTPSPQPSPPKGERVAQSCPSTLRLLPVPQGKTADLQNKSALPAFR
jgi:hypothetical protein